MALGKRRGAMALLAALTVIVVVLIVYRVVVLEGTTVRTPTTMPVAVAVFGIFLAAAVPIALGLTRERQRARFSLATPLDDPIPSHENVLHLRCSDCGTTFDALDPGTRPLRTVCTGCGRPGIVRATTLQRVGGGPE